jgi:hypothetical protein
VAAIKSGAHSFSARRQLQKQIVATILLTLLLRQLQASIWSGSGMSLPKVFFEASVLGCNLPQENNKKKKWAKSPSDNRPSCFP